jgi:hypothetical protein
MINIRVTAIGILIAFALALAAVMALTTSAGGRATPNPSIVECCY